MAIERCMEHHDRAERINVLRREKVMRWLTAAREDAGLSMREAARRADVSPSALLRVERGEKWMPHVVRKVIAVLRVARPSGEHRVLDRPLHRSTP